MKVVQASWLEGVMDAGLLTVGMGPARRREVIDGILFAALRGIDTHGVPLFRTYLDELRTGRAKIHPHFSYRPGKFAIQRLDADGALGINAGYEATRKTMALAKQYGIGAVLVANSNHFGAASIYTNCMAREGLIGLALTNSDALVVPINGKAPRLGTNPISVAAAGNGDDLFSADFSTSQGSFLRSLALGAAGAPIPEGIFASTDDSEGPKALLPLGGHKGQCLGMIVTLLSAVLAGEPFDWELPNLFAEPFDAPRRISHLLVAIDVSCVSDREAFRARVSRYLQTFRATPATADQHVQCPGDREARLAEERSRLGIPIAAADHAFFRGLERRIELPPS